MSIFNRHFSTSTRQRLQSPQRSARRRARGARFSDPRGRQFRRPRRDRDTLDAGRHAFDERGRTDEQEDLHHWSAASLNVTSATIGPFSGGDHYFYAKAEEQYGAPGARDGPLPIPSRPTSRVAVDCRRHAAVAGQLLADGTLLPVATTWPAAAELDTFLAVGGVPVRRRRPDADRKRARGFDYDTIGPARVGGGDAALSILATYKHVVWMNDYEALEHEAYTDPSNPMPLLAYMTTTGQGEHAHRLPASWG